MKVYNLNFKGYWRDVKRKGIPSVSGVYLVYKCTYTSEIGKVKLIELIYMGQAQDLQERIENHTKRNEFLKECDSNRNEILCYAIAEVDKKDLNIVENALIYAQQPKLNDKYKDKFNYEPSEFHIEGRCALMKYLDFAIQ